MIGQTNKAILKNKLQRNLRKAMTDAERLLWQALRGRQISGHKFRRQHPFDKYILDFVCLEKSLVIEVDGGQHQKSQASDNERTEKLVGAGFRVLRFWNNEVLGQFEAVKERIWLELQKTAEPHPHLNPLPEGEETILLPPISLLYEGEETILLPPISLLYEGEGTILLPPISLLYEGEGTILFPPIQGEG